MLLGAGHREVIQVPFASPLEGFTDFLDNGGVRQVGICFHHRNIMDGAEEILGAGAAKRINEDELAIDPAIVVAIGRRRELQDAPLVTYEMLLKLFQVEAPI